MRLCLKIIKIMLLLMVLVMMKLNQILTSIFLFTAQFQCRLWIVTFIFHTVQIEVIVITVESSRRPVVAWSHAWRGQRAMMRFCYPFFLVVAFSSPLLCIGEVTQKKKEAGEAVG